MNKLKKIEKKHSKETGAKDGKGIKNKELKKLVRFYSK